MGIHNIINDENTCATFLYQKPDILFQDSEQFVQLSVSLYISFCFIRAEYNYFM